MGLGFTPLLCHFHYPKTFYLRKVKGQNASAEDEDHDSAKKSSYQWAGSRDNRNKPLKHSKSGSKRTTWAYGFYSGQVNSRFASAEDEDHESAKKCQDQ